MHIIISLCLSIPPSIIMCVLLWQFPNGNDENVKVKGPSGHHLFISTFILLLKFICDDTYSDKNPSHVPEVRMHKRV